MTTFYTKTDKIKWEDADFKWELAPTEEDADRYTWNDVTLLEEIMDSGKATGDAISDLSDEKKKKLIRLVMRRRGIKMYDESKEVQNIEAHAKSVELMVEEVKATILAENINV